MNTGYRYRLMRSGEEAKVCRLVVRVFNEAVAPFYSEEGIREFLSFVTSESLCEREKTQRQFVLVALDGDKIIGVIAIRYEMHISLLFVDRDYQRRGIAAKLFDEGLKQCLERNPKVKTITVNASPNSVAAYEALGFSKVRPESEVKGIRFVPMRRPLA